MALTTRMLVQIDTNLTGSGDLQTPRSDMNYSKIISWASGIVADTADKIWSDTRTINASTTEDIDLKGSLTDALGVAFTPAKLKAIIVYADPLNTNNVVLFGDAAEVPIITVAGIVDDPVTAKVSVKPGGLFIFVDPSLAGIAITATTGDIIQVANSGAGTSVTYTIILICASA